MAAIKPMEAAVAVGALVGLVGLLGRGSAPPDDGTPPPILVGGMPEIDWGTSAPTFVAGQIAQVRVSLVNGGRAAAFFAVTGHLGGNGAEGGELLLQPGQRGTFTLHIVAPPYPTTYQFSVTVRGHYAGGLVAIVGQYVADQLVTVTTPAPVTGVSPITVTTDYTSSISIMLHNHAGRTLSLSAYATFYDAAQHLRFGGPTLRVIPAGGSADVGLGPIQGPPGDFALYLQVLDNDTGATYISDAAPQPGADLHFDPLPPEPTWAEDARVTVSWEGWSTTLGPIFDSQVTNLPAGAQIDHSAVFYANAENTQGFTVLLEAYPVRQVGSPGSVPPGVYSPVGIMLIVRVGDQHSGLPSGTSPVGLAPIIVPPYPQ